VIGFEAEEIANKLLYLKDFYTDHFHCPIFSFKWMRQLNKEFVRNGK
jgi:hypothetical protein